MEVSVQIVERVAGLLIEHGAHTDWHNTFLRWRDWLSQEYTLPMLAGACELTLRLTDDQEMRQLNQRFRQQDRPTDVLAFASLEVNMPSIPLPAINLGDIVISVPTAHTQAIAQGWTLQQELIWLASHGFLHLLGWDHPDPASLAEMWQIQETLMQCYIPQPISQD
jgi:conserved hypothetical protein TIGR00043